MDSKALRALHVAMMHHMIIMGFHDTAKVFARETAITYPPPAGYDEKYCFLDDWWGIFHDIYKNGGELTESSNQAEARDHVQAQAQAQNESINTKTMAYTKAHAQACSQATALRLDQRQAQAPTHAKAFHARAMAHAEAPGHARSQTLTLPLDQAQAQSWTLANNGVATPKHYIHPMGPSSVQQHHLCANNTNIASQPVLGVRWTDEELSVFRQGCASPAYISNSRHNEQSSTQNSRRVRCRVNGPENETGTGSASNGASDRVSTHIALATSQPPGREPMDLDVVHAQLYM